MRNSRRPAGLPPSVRQSPIARSTATSRVRPKAMSPSTTIHTSVPGSDGSRRCRASSRLRSIRSVSTPRVRRWRNLQPAEGDLGGTFAPFLRLRNKSEASGHDLDDFADLGDRFFGGLFPETDQLVRVIEVEQAQMADLRRDHDVRRGACHAHAGKAVLNDVQRSEHDAGDAGLAPLAADDAAHEFLLGRALPAEVPEALADAFGDGG